METFNSHNNADDGVKEDLTVFSRTLLYFSFHIGCLFDVEGRGHIHQRDSYAVEVAVEVVVM